MSNVEEGLMAHGSFSIRFREDTPRSILHKCWQSPFALVRIYDQTISLSQVGTAAGLFTGVLHKLQGYEISGAGQTWFLGEASDMWGGDWTEVGPYSLSSVYFDGSSGGTLEDWAGAILSATDCGLSLGTVATGGSKRAGSLTRRTAKSMLDNFVVPVFGREYRVTPELAVDFGFVTNLYPLADPAPLVIRKGGRDDAVLGLDTDDLRPSMSVEGFLTRGTAFLEAAGYDYSVYNTNSYKNPQGAALNWGRHQATSSESTAGWIQALDTQDSAAKLAAQSEVAQAVTLSAREYALTRRVKVGDRIYVYDLDRGLFDQTNTLRFKGQVIYPVLLRVQQMSWPITQGMTVWLDNRHQTTFDDVVELTQYIEFEPGDGPTSITVGRPPRTLGKVLGRRR